MMKEYFWYAETFDSSLNLVSMRNGITQAGGQNSAEAFEKLREHLAKDAAPNEVEIIKQFNRV